jgi:ribonuclease D
MVKGSSSDIALHRGDLPEDLDLGLSVAIDTETMGLNLQRDRLCLVQLSAGDGSVHLVQFEGRGYDSPRLAALLADPKVEKIFHYGRFDLAVLRRHITPVNGPLFCTKIASKLARTYTDRHGLRDLCRDMLSIDISKQQQSSDWGASDLSREQIEYAAADVLYLHRLKANLEEMLRRHERLELARAAFAFLPTRVALDLAGWPDVDIFAHS